MPIPALIQGRSSSSEASTQSSRSSSTVNEKISNPLGAVFGIGLFHVRDLRPAGTAPGSPEFHQNHVLAFTRAGYADDLSIQRFGFEVL